MENIREGNTLSDKKILNNVAKAVNRSITMLAEDMNEKKGTLYQITTGRNNISTRIKAKLLENFPTLNRNYIETGTGDIISKRPKAGDDTFQEEVFMQLALLNKKVSLLNEKIDSLFTAINSK